MSDNPNIVRFEVKLNTETGKLEVNIFDYLRELTDDQREALMWDNGFWPFISENLLKSLTEDYANDTMSSSIFAFRKRFFTQERMFEMLKTFCEGVIASCAYHLSCARKDRDAYWELERLIRDYFSDGQYFYNGFRPTPDQIMASITKRREAVHGRSYFVEGFVREFWTRFLHENPEITLPTNAQFEEQMDES